MVVYYNMNSVLIKDAVLKIGQVISIEGRTVFIEVDKNKNASDLLYDGTIIKNISVGGYIEIRKGFLSIIGKVEGEKIVERKEWRYNEDDYQIRDINKRILTIKLCGYINFNGRFIGGIKELPLLSSEAYLLTDNKIHLIHNLLKPDDKFKISIARTDIEEIPIDFPIDGLFNSHIAIFGNTGSGKSNTLASLYHSLIEKLSNRKKFDNCHFFFFDFNSEYISENCISKNKKVFNLANLKKGSDKIPIKFDELMDIDNLAILFEASEKTQKPFLRRALRYYKKVTNSIDEGGGSSFLEYFKNILRYDIKKMLFMSNKDVAYKIMEYINDIFSYFVDMDTVQNNIGFHDTNKYFHLLDGREAYLTNLQEHPEYIDNTYFIPIIDGITSEKLSEITYFNMFYIFILLQFIHDLHIFQVQSEHILPFIVRYKSKKKNIEDVFTINEIKGIWDESNIVVVNMHDLNIDMKKTVPLLLAKYIYNHHKHLNTRKNQKSLSIIIDEAHNILSKQSFREKEDWKDYRLETFEEIIKEGRKFGVFVTISSQRPNDISETIISQAHNYFIHQLINQRDLQTIGNAVSYIDKVTEESIPTLPVGTCIFSGIATPMPLKIKIDELPDNEKPDSKTLKFADITNENIIYL
jgi:DNA helicase HerA-like ATPase